MKSYETVLWMTSVFCCLLIKSTPAAKGTKKGTPFKWQLEKARKVLAKEMTDMLGFQQELRPFLRERVSGTPENREVQEHIKKRMNSLGWTVEEDRFEDDTPLGRKEFNNIIATYNPQAAEKLVLACHFDSKYFGKKTFIGATDSAVPCAILIDTANKLQCMLQREPVKASAKNLTVQLLFLDGEEAFVHWTATDSIYGARHLAQMWANKPDPVNPSKSYLETITHFVLLDLIGASDTKFFNLMPASSDLYTQLNKIEDALFSQKLLSRQDSKRKGGYSHDLFPKMAPFEAGVQDDHVPFMHRDVKILHLISYPFPKVWHKTSDNLASMDMSLIDDFCRIFRIFVASYLQHSGLDSTCKKSPDHSGIDSDPSGWWQGLDDYYDQLRAN